MELIDKSKLEKQMKEESLHLFNAMYNGYSKAMKCVRLQPVVYDIDKIIERLGEMKKNSNIDAVEFPEFYDGFDMGINRAIETIKGGIKNEAD